MNSINDGFEHGKPLGRQADAGSDDDTIIGLQSQQTLDCRTSVFIRPDEANLALPSTFSELLQRNRSAGVNLLGVHAGWQSRIGIVK